MGQFRLGLSERDKRRIKGHIANGTKSKLNGQMKDDLSTLGRSPSEKPH